MFMLQEFLQSRAITLLYATAGVLLLYLITSYILSYFSTRSQWLRSQEWIQSQDKQWFSWYRTRLRSILFTRKMIMENYEKLQQKLYVLPQYASDPLLLLPPNKLKDLLQRPDDEVNLLIVLKELTAARWTDDEITHDPFHMDVVRHQLTRKLPLMTADVHQELALGFEEELRLNDNDEWRTVSAFGACANVVSRAANRVFSGPVLCRDQEFLKHTMFYAQGIFVSAGVINLFPKWLRPIVAPLIVHRLKKHVNICKKIAMPIVRKRLEATQRGDQEEVQNDALQWVIEECLKREDSIERDPDRITRRLLRLNVVAIHTTSITMVNTLLDLYSSPRVSEFVAALREECSRVLVAHDGEWTKGAVNQLVRIDSTIKESMRLSAIFSVGVIRQVTKPSGVDLGDGVIIPQGVRIASPNAAIHRDERYYSQPLEYDALRFARTKERGQGVVTTSETFLAFGHGRHACPGRFFAAQEMKLMLAYVVMNFDVKLPGPRPRNFEFKNAMGPPKGAKLLFRRRLK